MGQLIINNNAAALQRKSLAGWKIPQLKSEVLQLAMALEVAPDGIGCGNS